MRLSPLQKLERGLARVQAGWTKKVYKKKCDGVLCYCTLGALGATVWVQPEEAPAVQLFKKANDLDFVASWNDAPERTKAQVIAAFKKAIRYAKKFA